MKRISFHILLCVCVIFLYSGLAYAGMGYYLKCDNCGVEQNLLFGGGKASKVVANGYCYSCKKYVRISHGTAKDEKGLYQNYNGSKWTTMTNEEILAIEEPLGYIYCPDSGKRALYPCPVCGNPFSQIKEDDFGTIKNPARMFCPICDKKALQGKAGIMWD